MQKKRKSISVTKKKKKKKKKIFTMVESDIYTGKLLSVGKKGDEVEALSH